MPPTSNPPVTAKKRQSCDRCHGQKLRCIRVGSSEDDACNRCLRQGAHCVYSSSLPKGRPNMYRLADASIAPSNPPAAAPISPEHHRHHHPSPFTATADVNVSINASGINANAKASVNEDPMMSGPMDTSTSAATSTWPWLEPFNWNDMDVDGSEQDSNHWTSNAQNTVDPHSDAGAAFLDAFPSLLGWASTGNSDADGRPPSPIRLHEHGHGLGSDLFESTSTSTSTIVTDKSGPDVGIARLSQLSTRLYPLHQSSCNLADAAGSSGQSKDRSHARQNQLIDDAAFKSVAGWLVHVSANLDSSSRNDPRDSAVEKATAGDTLHDAFSASHHLLETLRCLQADSVLAASCSGLGDSKSASSSTGGARLDPWGNFTPPLSRSSSNDDDSSYCEKRKGSSSYARPSCQYSNTVVRHLVMACHTLLLNIYVAVLIALQHDADRWSSNDSDVHADPAALADIRLVLAVQLCSYLIERQHQAVDAYLSPLSAPPHEGSGSQQPSSPGSTTAHREVMTDLRMEVQQRLDRLRLSLRI